MTDQERKQTQYLDLFDGVTRSLADLDADECMYNVQRLATTADARGVEITPEAGKMMAETLREKGYKSITDEDFKTPETLNGPVASYPERIQAGELSPSVADIQKLYFANIIYGCEATDQQKPTLGHPNLNAALCEAVVEVQNKLAPQQEVAAGIER